MIRDGTGARRSRSQGGGNESSDVTCRHFCQNSECPPAEIY